MVENPLNLKENLMLKEKDKIFKNLYGFEDWKLEGAKKRGIWSNTKELIAMGSEKIVEEIKNSQLRATFFLIAILIWLIEVCAGWSKNGTAMPSRNC